MQRLPPRCVGDAGIVRVCPARKTEPFAVPVLQRTVTRCAAPGTQHNVWSPNEQARFTGHRPPRRGALDQQGQRRPAVPLEQARRSGGTRRPHPVRARLVDGLAADLRPAGARAAVADGLLRGARLRHLVRRHGGLRPLDKDRDHNSPIANGADDCLRGRATTSRNCGARSRCWSTASRRARCAPRCSRSAIPEMVTRLASTPWCGPARARRRSPSAAKKLPEFRAKNSPADRPQVRALDLRARSSRHRRRQRDRGVRRRDPQARQFDAERHLCRHVREPAGRAIRRRSRCRPSSCAASTTASRASTDLIEVLREAAESGQAVRRDAGHRARLVPAEELRDLLSHPGELLLAARSRSIAAGIESCTRHSGQPEGRPHPWLLSR